MDILVKIENIIKNVEKVLYGKRKEIKFALAAMLSEGHILIEDVPGVGKTILARALAKSIDCSFKRIQFTPDLLPSDVTGVSIYNQKINDFEFKKGPIFSQVVLADEINRGTPRTQSSLLESMGESQVSVEGKSWEVPKPFIVMATQNPIEYEGTFPLPEAQLDRFLIRLNLGYPDGESEIKILNQQQYQHPLQQLEPVMDADDFIEMQKKVKEIYIKEDLKKYIVDIVKATREHSYLQLGVSPRGSLALFKMSQAYAVIQDRDYVIPDDVKELAPYILNHRMILKPERGLKGSNTEQLTQEILKKIEVPEVE